MGLSVFTLVAASDREVLPCIGDWRIGVDGLGLASAAVHSGEVVPVDRSDGILVGPRRELIQVEVLP